MLHQQRALRDQLDGHTLQPTALVHEALDSSPATLKREWTAARAWLRRELTTA